MKTSRVVLAVGGLLALGGATLGAQSLAGDMPKMDAEKCYGLAKAGSNDCAGAGHACAGQAKEDHSGKEFVTLPKGTCERLVGGSLRPK